MRLSAVLMPPVFSACLLATFVVWYSGDVFALERTTLALAGSTCRESQPGIIEALKHFEGVARVETELIPDHVLIDHDGRKLNQDQLVGIINAHGREGRCQGVLMRSCITGSPSAEESLSSRSR